MGLQIKRQPLIKILVTESLNDPKATQASSNIQRDHPINKTIRLINQFVIEAFLKQSTSNFIAVQKPKIKHGKNAKNKICANQTYQFLNATFAGPSSFQQMSPTTANNSIANVDMPAVQNLAKQLQITLPKNGDLRGKAFICHAKEQMLHKLFETVNKSNKVELHFKRSLFQHYRGFIGRGNNSQLLF